MSEPADARYARELDELRASGQYKQASELQGPQGPEVTIDGRRAIMLASNNYLGLANHPAVLEAARTGVDAFGAGTASVRFICGTMTCHLELERTIAEFLGCEAAVTYISCWDANVGLIPTLASAAEDAIFSDALNHASIIDAIRLSRAQRFIYRHGDIEHLAGLLADASSARTRLIVTDGVFSMEGDVAPLPALYELAQRHNALLVVDESHATGVLGATGRGTAEHFGLPAGAIIQTSTLGKALCGACGGYVAATRTICDYLLQKSRPHLFSNALPPAVCRAAAAAIDVLRREPERLAMLSRNAEHFRERVKTLGLKTVESITPIVPIIVGQTATAFEFQKQLLGRGVFISGFGYPVVPQGEARLRAQLCAAHTPEQLDRALDAIGRVANELGLT